MFSFSLDNYAYGSRFYYFKARFSNGSSPHFIITTIYNRSYYIIFAIFNAFVLYLMENTTFIYFIKFNINLTRIYTQSIIVLVYFNNFILNWIIIII